MSIEKNNSRIRNRLLPQILKANCIVTSLLRSLVFHFANLMERRGVERRGEERRERGEERRGEGTICPYMDMLMDIYGYADGHADDV